MNSRPFLRRLGRIFRTPAMRMGARLTALADGVRDAGDFRVAAVLYEEALRRWPGRAAIHVQAGHMFKEAGDLAKAEAHYRHAGKIAPGDVDAALQLARLYASSRRFDEAAAAYARAAAVAPGSSAAASGLAELERLRPAGVARAEDGLLGELLPRSTVPLALSPGTLHVFPPGRPERTASGEMRTVRGLEALRGFHIPTGTLAEFEILCDGRPIHRAAPPADGRPPGSKFVFNVWHDFSPMARGRSLLEYRCRSEDGAIAFHRASVNVAEPLREAEHPASDGLVELASGDGRAPELQVAARSSMVRPARRRLLPGPPRTVLVQRVDQLGDLVVSVAAIRRLRALLPGARLVGLLSSANAALAGTLGLFDEILVADFPEDVGEGRRIMTAEAQRALRGRLAGYDFDIAIDLSESADSRPLLLLSGAHLRFGAGTRGDLALSAGVAGFTRDAINGHEIVSPALRAVGMVEWMAAVLSEQATVAPRPDLPRDRLRHYGLPEDARYILLHTGARLAFARWPHFAALCRLILDRTELMVVTMADDPAGLAGLTPDLVASPRLRLVSGRLPFDDFDALLSFCAVMVGNDSGPKHLAALRGTKVVSIHMARLNWNEWGQEGDGVILSRRLPCAGCAIQSNPEECGKGFACLVDIAPEEVFAAVAALL